MFLASHKNLYAAVVQKLNLGVVLGMAELILKKKIRTSNEMRHHRQDNQREKGGTDLYNSDEGCAAFIYKISVMRNM